MGSIDRLRRLMHVGRQCGRAIRWKYALPRVLLLAGVCLALYFGLAPMTRWTLVQAGQRASGAKVDVGSVTADLLGGEMVIADIQLANRDDPWTNLIAASAGRVKLDTADLLRRKFTVVHGAIEGIAFQTRRDNNGTLPGARKQTAEPERAWDLGGAGDAAEQWLDRQLALVRSDWENELQTVRLAHELANRWPGRLAELRSRAASIEQQSALLKQDIERMRANPLRHADKIPPTLERLTSLRTESNELRGQLGELWRDAQRDRTALETARRHDEQLIRERLRLEPLDRQVLSRYLLGPIWSKRLATGAYWLNKGRWLLQPERGVDSRPSTGLRIRLPGYDDTPDLLVRELSLSGSASHQGAPVSFRGWCRDWTPQPRRHQQPTRLHVVSDGAIQMVGDWTSDRRHEQPTDHLALQIPALAVPSQELGDRNRLTVILPAGKMEVDAQINLVDDRLEGEVRLLQRSIQPRLRLGAELADRIQPDSIALLADGLDHLEATIHLRGTLQRPDARVESNLGDQLADGLTRFWQAELDRRRDELSGHITQFATDQWTKLERSYAAEQSAILERLEIGDREINRLKSHLGSAGGGTAQWLDRGRNWLQGRRNTKSGEPNLRQ